MKRIALFLSTNLAIVLVLSLSARLLALWFSRQREFRADRGGAEPASRPAMIAALRRLASLHPQPLPDRMAAFGSAGGWPGGWKRLFMTHPPLAERIAALEAAGQR